MFHIAAMLVLSSEKEAYACCRDLDERHAQSNLEGFDRFALPDTGLPRHGAARRMSWSSASAAAAARRGRHHRCQPGYRDQRPAGADRGRQRRAVPARPGQQPHRALRSEKSRRRAPRILVLPEDVRADRSGRAQERHPGVGRVGARAAGDRVRRTRPIAAWRKSARAPAKTNSPSRLSPRWARSETGRRDRSAGSRTPARGAASEQRAAAHASMSPRAAPAR